MLAGEDQAADSGVGLNPPAQEAGEHLLKITQLTSAEHLPMDQLPDQYYHQLANQSNRQAAIATGPTLASFTGWEWLLISVLISIILISIIGNCLVCVAIFTDRRLRKLGNAFIVSLAIADLFVSCLVMTFALCNDLMNYWMFGEWFCDIWISFDIMCSTASILNLCAISLDRFIHIKDCLLYNQLMTKRVAISAVIMIWIISALVSFVPINLGWHKPNHFKQPAGNVTTGAEGGSHLDFLPANVHNEPQVALMAPENSNEATATRVADQSSDQFDLSDQSDDGALNREDQKLALIGHNDAEHDRQRTEAVAEPQARGLTSGHAKERHKRQASSEHSIIETATANRRQLDPPQWGDNLTELGEKISEIRRPERGAGGELQQDQERSQIANKLRQSSASSSLAGRQGECGGSGGPQSLMAPSDGVSLISGRGYERATLGQLKRARWDAAQLPISLPQQPDEKLKQLARPETNLAVAAAAQVPSNSLHCDQSQKRDGRPGSGLSWARQSNDYDESKQSSLRQARELHENELSDQVAVSPAGEFNPETQPRVAVDKQHAGQEPLEQIKHSQFNPSSRPLPAAGELAVDIDKREGRVSEYEPNASGPSVGHSTGARPTSSDEGKLETGRGRQTDQAKVSGRLNPPLGDGLAVTRRRVARSAPELDGNSRQNGQTTSDGRLRAASSRKLIRDATGQQQQSRPTNSAATSAGPTPNELPQCMLTLTPTYAVISSTISFYIPCIIMLGLYSKLFACARRHVRNIKAISKAPQPIGFGSPAESPMGAPPARGPATNAVPVSGIPNESVPGRGGGEIINGRRADAAADASKRQEQAPWSPGQIAPEPTTTVNNNNGAGSQSLSSQCQAKLARFVRCSEPKLADRSKTWIKFGRQPSATTLKPQAQVAAKLSATPEAESSLSTASKVAPAHVRVAGADANSKKTAQGACSPLLMKLNNQNVQQTHPSVHEKIDRADYNDGRGIELADDDNKPIAQGNEMEPFLSGHNHQPETGQSQRTELCPMNRPPATSECLGAGDDNELDEEASKTQRNVTNPSQLDTVGAPKSGLVVGVNYTPIRAAPLKSSINSNHHYHRHTVSSRKHNHQQQIKQQTNQLATHKAAITLGIIMGTFLFCWVPFFCLNIIKAYHGDSIPASLFRAFTWLGYANSALNPIIYGIHNSEFRNAFNRIFFKHLTLKNGRQYLNRRFSYDLRPHNDNDNNINHHDQQQQQQHHHQFRWRFNNANQENQYHDQCFETRQQLQQHQPSQLQQNPNQRQPVSTPTSTTPSGKGDMTFSQTHPASPVASSQHQNSSSSQHHYQLEV